MAVKGLSFAVAGKYTNTSGTISYTDGMVIGKAIEYSASIESTDNSSNLYGDNTLAEVDKNVFKSGTLTLNTTELINTVSAWLLGLGTVTHSYTPAGASQAVNVTEYVFDDNSAAPTIGFGIIEEHQINGVNKYKAVILCRCDPKVPNNAAKTRGETVEWQTPSLDMAISRSEQNDEDYVHPWKLESWHDSELAAQNYLKSRLGVSTS